jgi:TRAP-type C4-dicarboxylate transport system permease small subunit
MLRPYTQFLNKLERVIMVLIGLILAVMTLSIGYQVVLRYIFNRGNIWSEELARVLFAWLTLFGSAVAIRKGSHLKADFLFAILKGTARYVLQMVCHLLALGFLVYLMPYSVKLCMMTTKNQTAGLRLPLAIAYACIPVGIVLMVLMLIEQILIVTHNYRNPETAVEGGSV